MSRLNMVPPAMIPGIASEILIAAYRDLERSFKDSRKRKSKARLEISEASSEISSMLNQIACKALILLKGEKSWISCD